MSTADCLSKHEGTDFQHLTALALHNAQTSGHSHGTTGGAQEDPGSPRLRRGGRGNPWRVGPPSERSVLVNRQLDKAALWLQTWDISTRCGVLEAILRCSDYTQFRFMWTVSQPWLHRDLMYYGHSLFPQLSFQPLSTHLSRRFRLKARRVEGPKIHRVNSCYPQVDHPSPPPCTLPPLPISSSILSSSSSTHFTETSHTHVRRHIQNESSPRAVKDCSSKKTKAGASILQHSTETNKVKGNKLPPEGQQLISWYLQHWNDEERSTFLHQLLVTLDPREHYFLSTCLVLRQQVDFLTQLPESLALHILSFFSPRDLGVVSRVNRAWRRLANHNSLWETKCREVKLEVPVSDNPVWKRVFKDNHFLRQNWSDGRCRVTDFKGHKLSVLAMCLDETRLASGSADNTVIVWDIATGRRLHVLTGHSKGVWCLQFFTKHLLLSGSYDNTIRVWNLRSGTLLRTLLGHMGPVWCLARHGRFLVSGSNDKTAKVWDIGRCVLLNTLMGHKASVFAVDLGESGDTVYTGSADRTVRLWRRDTGQCVRRVVVRGTEGILSISCSHGYFACSHGTSICLYKGTTLVATFKEHEERVETVKLRMDPETGEGIIVSGGQDGLCKYWDIHRSESSIQTFTGHTDAVNCIYFDEQRIVSASQDHKIRLWDFIV